jgi:DNA-binding transcriptional LysR family regulator
MKRFTIETVCESAFTVGIKEMTLSGMGIAWLPHGLIERELEAGALASLHQQLGGPGLTIAMYRMRQNRSPALDEIWRVLEHQAPSP